MTDFETALTLLAIALLLAGYVPLCRLAWDWDRPEVTVREITK